ncbi:hypothetical protein K0M31_019540 [Melipona bicolor]|uniref:Dipeptidase n=1 Tax=Melipona bicolor TaxID=60889 RepID=A0AA40G2L3_9HYME|nr:hypothetical protein K0M31_019540 [Melipona bicolor]
MTRFIRRVSKQIIVGGYRFFSTPTGLEDVSRYPQLLATLLEDPTWTEDDIKKLAGLNLLRVFAKVEQVRDEWHRAAVLPVEKISPPDNSACVYGAS